MFEKLAHMFLLRESFASFTLHENPEIRKIQNFGKLILSKFFFFLTSRLIIMRSSAMKLCSVNFPLKFSLLL